MLAWKKKVRRFRFAGQPLPGHPALSPAGAGLTARGAGAAEDMSRGRGTRSSKKSGRASLDQGGKREMQRKEAPDALRRESPMPLMAG